MFSNLFSSSISLATVTPSLVTVGDPHDFSITTLRPRGPKVTLTVFARMSSPVAMRCRASCENTMVFADMFGPFIHRAEGLRRAGARGPDPRLPLASPAAASIVLYLRHWGPVDY